MTSKFGGRGRIPARGPTKQRKSRFKPIPATAAGRGPFESSEAQPGSASSSYPLYNSKATSVGSFTAPGGNGPQAKALRAQEYGKLISDSKGRIPKRPEVVLKHDESLDRYNIETMSTLLSNRYMIRQGVDEIHNLPDPVMNMATEDIADMPPHMIAGEALRFMSNHTDRRGYMTGSTYAERMSKAKAYRDYVQTHLTDEQRGNFEYLWHEHFMRPKKKNGREMAEMVREWQATFGPWPNGMSPEELAAAEMNLSDEEKKMFSRYSEYYPTGKTPTYHEGEDFRWGNMLTVPMPLERRIKSARAALRAKPGYIGAFRYPHRAHPVSGDGMAFGHRKRVNGGTILLDCSGSMSLSAEEINDLIEGAPAATIACYASINAHNPHVNEAAAENPGLSLPGSQSYSEMRGPCAEAHYTGVLVQAASNGRAAMHDKLRSTMSGGNEVDGPALDWLATQERPLIWVSDGGVTGMSESTPKALEYDAFQKVARHKIKHVATIEDAVSLMRKLGGTPK